MRLIRRSTPEARTTSTGILCDSKYEMNVLESLIARHIPFTYHPSTREYSSRVRMAWCADCESTNVRQGRKYTPDLELAGGLVECKGKFAPKDRNLMDQFLKQNPTLKLRFIFQSNNKLIKGKDKRYGDWCDDRGIEYAIGTVIPAEWARG